MRFIHLADVHLGAKPDQRYSWSTGRDQEIWETFRQVIEQAGRRQADLLLIAGDLFHGQPLLRELKEVNYLFSTIQDTEVVLIAGNHDYLRKNSAYCDFVWNKNVHFLKKTSMQRVELSRIHTYVYGFSYDCQQITEERYAKAIPGQEEGFHILLAHGGDGQHIPIQYGALAQAGFSYVALGHIHQPQILSRTQKTAMAYSGSLEPIEKHEEGKHGYIWGEWKDQSLKLELVAAARRAYETLTFPIQPNMGQYEIENGLQELIEKSGEENMYHLSLEGEKELGQRIDKKRLYALGRVVDVWDRTHAAYDLQELRRRYEGTLIGEYIWHFQGHPLSATEQKALDYGLQALLETKE